jgi:hypothetical protein
MTLRALLACLAIGLAGVSARLSAQTVVVADPGPGPVGRRLEAALLAPHHLVPPGGTPAVLPRDSVYSSTVIVLGRDAYIESRVQGDVFVVGGNAFLRPGAQVDGSVIAIGGGVYNSLLAIVRGSQESHRDFTFDVSAVPGGGYALRYRLIRATPTPFVSFPGVFGLRIPSYDRSEGLSLPFAPAFSLDSGFVVVEPTVTYRSHLGAFDPSLDVVLQPSRRLWFDGFVGRSTYTNDAWIWTNLVNSASVLGLGIDTRNYYRADRAEVTAHWLWESTTLEVEPFIGAHVERDRPVGPDSQATGSPWSFFGRNARDRILRPNPPAVRTRMEAALAGVRASWSARDVAATFLLANEAAQVQGGDSFVQSTAHGHVRFPTFGQQFMWVDAHAVHTFGGTLLPQRWAYLGGGGTIITMDELEMGGDELLYVESNYFIPFPHFDLPLLGPPSLTIRHAIGSAGVGHLPRFEQNLSLRAAISFARFEITLDPRRGKVESGFGLSITR